MDWFVVLVMVAVFTLMVCLTRVCRRLRQRHYSVPAESFRKGHSWCMVDIFPQPTYCNISEHRIVEGASCAICGICVEDHYMPDADRMLPCKELATDTVPIRHHWIKGNLPPCSVCVVCSESCGDLPQLHDFRCCWCGRATHEQCVNSLDTSCDLGSFRESIVPPNCLQLKLVGVRGRRRFVVKSVVPALIPQWKPVIVVANRKSGNGDADNILQSFRRILNPLQVI